MSWLRLDDGFAEHPKVEQLTDKAFRLHVAALCYSARKLTDGFLSMKAVKVLAAIVDAPRVDRYTAELEQAGLWLVVDDGYRINDYLDYNPDAEAVKHARAKNAERQLRHRSRNAESNAQRNGVTDGVTNGVSNTPPIPSPSERTDLSAVVPTPRGRETLLHELAEALHDHDDRTVWVLEREARHVDDRFLEHLATTCHLNRKGSGYAVNALRAERGRQLVANVDLGTIGEP